MPIRFQCDQCGQRLSIARRKAGAGIACPACGLAQRVPGVPSPDDPGAEIEPEGIELEPSETESDADVDPGPFEFVPAASDSPPISEGPELFETIDLTEPAEHPLAVAVTASPPPPPIPAGDDEQPLPATRRTPVPWAVYAQATLLLAVAIGAFSAGYYLGHQDGALGNAAPAEQQAVADAEPDNGFADEEVLLEGRVLWMPGLGESAGDQGASFIVLPQDRVPQASLPIAGLQPGSDDDTARASIAAIRSAGGVFARADVDGTVAAVLPREGRYYLLLISRHVPRPEDQPIVPQDLVAMKQYFAEPEELIGAGKYAWRQEEIRVGYPVVECDFGLDGL